MRYPEPSGHITLLTDFGLEDHYVGVMKGVIARIHPEARVTDICHEVQAYSILQGAFMLAQSCRYFPEGTVHVAVVDPGVGSAREAIVAHAAGQYFVAPDNGVLSYVFEESEPNVRALNVDRFALTPRSNTFHGRDVFAPAAAWLSKNRTFADMGTQLDEWVALDPPSKPLEGGGWAGHVLNIDRFGNIVTGFTPDQWSDDAEMSVGGLTIRLGEAHYGAAPAGEPFVIEGSAGYLEVSIRQQSAAAVAGVTIGDQVRLDITTPA